MIFMMPMPPTSSEMPAIEPSTMFQIRFSSSARRSSSSGNDQSKVVFVGMALLQDLADHSRRLTDERRVSDLQSDLVQLRSFEVPTASAADRLDFAEAVLAQDSGM